ncbi:Rne/Rng family ribonuclease [Falsarthrobacter nasiphocae]|uniref:Ribonuclease E n=1 Tax=Falsarthrobacter nasiphocae TaxID=189863 RepID=A0AAE3YGS1_9MICC|nr:Rne/Rng family ribonuclease [Falsarthrobacter nasiphocae]MDR6892935.1 ribonuclease E [Falsarthrobacter nasiphocae]
MSDTDATRHGAPEADAPATEAPSADAQTTAENAPVSESGAQAQETPGTGQETTTTAAAQPEAAEDETAEDETPEDGKPVISIDPFDPFHIPSEVESLIVETIEAEVKERPSRKRRGDAEDSAEEGSSRRRRRRRRGDEDIELEGGEDEDPPNTITRVRAPRAAAAEGTGPENVTALKGSTRLEAKRQRRRDSRDGGRRRGVITEAEFLARRESVERTMIVREKDERIQIGVLEDGVLAEHFVSNTTQDSLIGNVYLGRVQNVLPSMEAAFIDIGRGRNAVLYAGEVNWDAVKLEGKPRRIENALKGGDTVLVQVSKDPVGHKGARLTSQISLPGRYLVYVPDGSMTGISRKLPDVERARLKKILKDHLPADAGVIVRTAAEGASEEELTNDINRLRVQWEGIQKAAQSRKTAAPELLYAEPDLTIKVVRDVFNEDFTKLIVSGENTWDQIEAYVTYVAPDLVERLEQWAGEDDVFAHHRIDEQINKALDRKVYLPSGGSLVIDRTEAMTVVDVNTGKFVGSGGNLEETVTKNNLEAAEEVVRQLRLRDIGGIIVIDFIDMVLESNRDLVLRRLVECLGRDRTKHQVAEVTSLGLVQMTRKRMGTGLLEVFGEQCPECAGRGMITHEEPILHRRPIAPSAPARGEGPGRSGRAERRRGRKRGGEQEGSQETSQESVSSQAPEGASQAPEAHDDAPAATAPRPSGQARDGVTPLPVEAAEPSETARAEGHEDERGQSRSEDSAGERPQRGRQQRERGGRSNGSRRGQSQDAASEPAEAAAEPSRETESKGGSGRQGDRRRNEQRSSSNGQQDRGRGRGRGGRPNDLDAIGTGTRLAPGSLASGSVPSRASDSDDETAEQTGRGRNDRRKAEPGQSLAGNRSEGRGQSGRSRSGRASASAETIEVGGERVNLPQGGEGGSSQADHVTLDKLDDVFSGKGGRGESASEEGRGTSRRRPSRRASAEATQAGSHSIEPPAASAEPKQAEKPAAKAPAAPSSSEKPAAAARPKRVRRVAVSAQGASEVAVREPVAQSAATRVVASAASRPAEQKSAAAAPVMLGVGVPASEIARPKK